MFVISRRCNTPGQLEKLLGDSGQLLSRLWPFFRHMLASVRGAVLEAMLTLLTGSSKVKIFMCYAVGVLCVGGVF